MNKKRLLGLILFGCLVVAGLFYGALHIARIDMNPGEHRIEEETPEDLADKQDDIPSSPGTKDIADNTNTIDLAETEPWLSSNPSDIQVSDSTDGMDADESIGDPEEQMSPDDPEEQPDDQNGQSDEVNTTVITAPERELIVDSRTVDYMAYIPEMTYSGKIEVALDIENPDLKVKAEAAILIDVKTKEILYHKNSLQPVFPASTSKLLTALTALDLCSETEEVALGQEVKMIASDSTRAYLTPGSILTIRQLLEGMLLPSGNDAAYAIACYVGRKSIGNPQASEDDALTEFVRLMNEKAKSLGVENSCFKTPDGYDALGQYTTAYDMGLIGVAAVENEIIREISGKSRSRNIFVSGEDVTWENTNALIKKGSNYYYSNCIGLKTGTSTMAGRCLVAAGERGDREILSVVMNSDNAGRWKDTVELLDYGLRK